VPCGEIQEKVLRNLQDDLLDPAEIEAYIQRGIRLFSAESPKITSTEWTGDGSAYEFALPTDWEEGVSFVKAVEYPIDQQVPCLLPRYSFAVLNGKLRLLEIIPRAGEKVRMFYSVSHSITESTSSLSRFQEEALSDLVTSLVAKMLAGKYLRMFEPGTIVEGVDYGRKAETYMTLSEKYWNLYKRQLPSIAEGTLEYFESERWRSIRRALQLR